MPPLSPGFCAIRGGLVVRRVAVLFSVLSVMATSCALVASGTAANAATAASQNRGQAWDAGNYRRHSFGRPAANPRRPAPLPRPVTEGRTQIQIKRHGHFVYPGTTYLHIAYWPTTLMSGLRQMSHRLVSNVANVPSSAKQSAGATDRCGRLASGRWLCGWRLRGGRPRRSPRWPLLPLRRRRVLLLRAVWPGLA
jgi:hypothetical protein